MEKYPVLSKSGYKYLVKVYELYSDYYCEKVLYVDLYESVVKRSIFGKSKEGYKKVYSKEFNKHNKEYLDYKKAVERTVFEYEISVEFIKKATKESNDKKFKEWDGVC